MDKKSTLAAAALAALAMAAGCARGAKTTATASADHHAGGGECWGVNTCKGTGECGAPAGLGEAGHSCAGQNSCKGKGWITLAQAECEGRHGTFKKG